MEQKTESEMETRIIRWLIGISFNSMVGSPAEGPYSKNCSIGGSTLGCPCLWKRTLFVILVVMSS